MNKEAPETMTVVGSGFVAEYILLRVLEHPYKIDEVVEEDSDE